MVWFEYWDFLTHKKTFLLGLILEWRDPHRPFKSHCRDSCLLATVSLCSPAGSGSEAHRYIGPLSAAPAPGSPSFVAQRGTFTAALILRSPREWGTGSQHSWPAGGAGADREGCIWGRGQSRAPVCPWQEKARYGTYLSLVRGAGGMVLELLLRWAPGRVGMKAHIPAHWQLSIN